jgi:hypothetical protein
MGLARRVLDLNQMTDDRSASLLRRTKDACHRRVKRIPQRLQVYTKFPETPPHGCK